MDAETRNGTDAAPGPGPGLRCLCGDTVLQTADGPRPIEDLVGGRPFLFACHPDDGHVNLVQADRVFVSDRERPVVRVVLDDGSSLDCTPEHPFMLEDGSFEEAHRLREGTAVRGLDDAMKGISAREMHVRTIGETGYLKTAPRAVHLHEFSRGTEANPERVVFADPPGGGALVTEPPLIYGLPGSSPRRVVRVEALPGRAKEVYDVSLPALHNFAAGVAGVFVHNCGHPVAPRRA